MISFDSKKIRLPFFVRIFTAFSWGWFFCSVAHAQFGDRIEETFVTATRFEQPFDEVLGSISLIALEDINAIKPYDLNDVLQLTPSIDVVRSGGRGSVNSFSIRGANSIQSLVLLNGQRFGSATLGLSQLGLIPVEFVSSVEILRGTGSVLYGSDAIAGIVNVRTTGQQSIEDKLDLNVNYGSHAYYRDSIAGNKKIGEVTISATLHREASEGIDNTLTKDGTNGDTDEYHRQGGLISILYQPDNNRRLNLLHIKNSGEADYDDPYALDPPTYSPIEISGIQLTQLSGINQFNDYYQAEITVSKSLDENENMDNPFAGYFDTKRTNLTWLNTVYLAKNTLVIGLSEESAKVDSSIEFANENNESQLDLSVESIFLQLSGENGKLAYQVGLRSDANSQYGSNSTASIALSANITERLRAYSHYSEGFRAPNFNELWFPGFGNSRLLPETSENRELGFIYNHKSYRWDLAFYHNDYSNLIQADPLTFLPANIGLARIRGIESTLTLLGDSIGELSIVVDYLNAIDKSNDKPIIGRPNRNMRMNWHKQLSALRVGAQAHFQSRRLSGIDSLPGYGILNLISSWQIADYYLVDIKVNNVFDKNYQSNAIFNEDGRNLLLGIKATF
jgi:vitamin B12 transporter